jgi:transcriptional regulator with XRE-family HTH domain
MSQDQPVTSIRRVLDEARNRAVRIRMDVGRELRSARLARGLSQRVVAHAAGITQSQLSRVERGVYPAVTIEVFAKSAAAVGLDLSVRVFPGGSPIRDKAHEALLGRFRQAVGERWTWAAEVPLPIPGDRRAWDRMLSGAGVRIAVEAETRPTDMQELQRRLALKKRDGQVDRLILVLADTQWCRQLVRLNDIETMFPVPGRVAMRALAEGRDPGGDAVVLV